jgi:hypothetical protein
VPQHSIVPAFINDKVLGFVGTLGEYALLSAVGAHSGLRMVARSRVCPHSAGREQPPSRKEGVAPGLDWPLGPFRDELGFKRACPSSTPQGAPATG